MTSETLFKQMVFNDLSKNHISRFVLLQLVLNETFFLFLFFFSSSSLSASCLLLISPYPPPPPFFPFCKNTSKSRSICLSFYLSIYPSVIFLLPQTTTYYENLKTFLFAQDFSSIEFVLLTWVLTLLLLVIYIGRHKMFSEATVRADGDFAKVWIIHVLPVMSVRRVQCLSFFFFFFCRFDVILS